MVDVIPGQETGNADYVVAGNAGVLANNPTDALEAISHWLEKDRLHYRDQANNARQLGHPRAAYDAAELTWALASSPEQSK
jgi:UDP-N-acetylglucosamine:LPS N-acetylglucosamine transferase